MQKIFNQINQSQPIKVIGLVFFFIIITTLTAHAQPPDASSGDVNAPIDGGLSLLLATGLGYGVKKLKEKRKAAIEE